jgi:hypothetical protein
LDPIPIRRARLIGIIVVLSMAFLGVIYPVLTATTVVETVTETVVQPSRTITTVTVLEGGDVAIRIESPGVRVTVYYERQEQVCTVRFIAMPLPRQPGVIAFPGTTVTVPGATATLVLNAPTEITATKPLITAFMTTGYTVLNITRTLTIGTYATVIPMPAFVYGLIEEACNLAYEIYQERYNQHGDRLHRADDHCSQYLGRGVDRHHYSCRPWHHLRQDLPRDKDTNRAGDYGHRDRSDANGRAAGPGPASRYRNDDSGTR